MAVGSSQINMCTHTIDFLGCDVAMYSMASSLNRILVCQVLKRVKSTTTGMGTCGHIAVGPVGKITDVDSAIMTVIASLSRFLFFFQCRGGNYTRECGLEKYYRRVKNGSEVQDILL